MAKIHPTAIVSPKAEVHEDAEIGPYAYVGDNCRIMGTVEDCVLSSEVVVEEGAYLKDCIVLRCTTIGKGARLENVIIDKNCLISADTVLKGNEKLPLVVPKGSKI